MRGRPERFHEHPCHRIIEIKGIPLIVFMTIGLENRRFNNLATPEIHQLFVDVWTEATGWLVNWYMIMPDHMHFFVMPGYMDIPLKSWVKYVKSQYTKAHLLNAPRLEVDYWDTTTDHAARSPLLCRVGMASSIHSQ